MPPGLPGPLLVGSRRGQEVCVGRAAGTIPPGDTDHMLPSSRCRPSLYRNLTSPGEVHFRLQGAFSRKVLHLIIQPEYIPPRSCVTSNLSVSVGTTNNRGSTTSQSFLTTFTLRTRAAISFSRPVKMRPV